MNDLITYLNLQIKALQKENLRLEEENLELKTYIFDLTDKDCPEDYKRVVKSELFNK